MCLDALEYRNRYKTILTFLVDLGVFGVLGEATGSALPLDLERVDRRGIVLSSCTNMLLVLLLRYEFCGFSYSVSWISKF